MRIDKHTPLQSMEVNLKAAVDRVCASPIHTLNMVQRPRESWDRGQFYLLTRVFHPLTPFLSRVTTRTRRPDGVRDTGG